MQIGEQVCQRNRLPFADRLVEGDVQSLFILRVFDVDNHAVDFCCALRHQHLVALMPADNIACHLIPNDGIDIAEFVQAAFDFFIRRIARL